MDQSPIVDGAEILVGNTESKRKGKSDLRRRHRVGNGMPASKINHVHEHLEKGRGVDIDDGIRGKSPPDACVLSYAARQVKHLVRSAEQLDSL